MSAASGSSEEAGARVLSKGWLVAVQGRLAYRAWETGELQTRHEYEIVGNLEFLAAPRSNTANTTPEDRATVKA
jgi:single-stranded DNA-binding protein